MASERPRRETRIDAAKAGRKKFLAPSACAACGDRSRYTSNGRCVTCSKEWSKRQAQEIQELLEKAGEG